MWTGSKVVLENKVKETGPIHLTFISISAKDTLQTMQVSQISRAEE